MNQFEIKGTYIEIVIGNASPYGNYVKIKLNVKVEEICRDCSLIFYEIRCNAPGFSLVLEGYIRNSVKHLI